MRALFLFLILNSKSGTINVEIKLKGGVLNLKKRKSLTVETINKIIWSILAILFLIIGIVGICIPVVPGTPFLLIAAFCLTKVVPSFKKKYLELKLKFNEEIKSLKQKFGKDVEEPEIKKEEKLISEIEKESKPKLKQKNRKDGSK